MISRGQRIKVTWKDNVLTGKVTSEYNSEHLTMQLDIDSTPYVITYTKWSVDVLEPVWAQKVGTLGLYAGNVWKNTPLGWMLYNSKLDPPSYYSYDEFSGKLKQLKVVED